MDLLMPPRFTVLILSCENNFWLGRSSQGAFKRDYVIEAQTVPNPQILWLISLSKICKLLKCASPQIANFSANRKFLENTTKLCLKTVLKDFFMYRYKFKLKHYMLYL
jgi:hypothetical protein